MYDSSPLEVLDPCLTSEEKEDIDNYFRSKGTCDSSWTTTRRDWAFAFFGVELFKKACSYKFYKNDKEIDPRNSGFYGYTKWARKEAGYTPLSRCCGMGEITIAYNTTYAMAEPTRDTLDPLLIIPLWKARLFQALFSRKAGAIATINNEQKSLIPAILDLGFETKSKWMYNPNSGNEIMLLFFEFPR